MASPEALRADTWLDTWLPEPMVPLLAPYVETAVPAGGLALVLLIGAAAWLVRRWRRGRALHPARSHRALARLSWQGFEELVAELYRRQGYAAHTTPIGADGGVDVIVESRQGRTIVQVKHWPQRAVGVAVVRELYALLDDFDADGGAVVASGRISPEAAEFAAGKPLELFDGADVVALARRLRRRSAPGTPLRGESDAYYTSQYVASIPSTRAVTCPNCGAEIAVDGVQHQ